MELTELTSLLKRKWQTLVVFMVVFTLIALFVSLVQTRKYRSEERFLVLQNYAEDVDPYAVTRSTEYLTGLLGEVIYSQSFMSKVIDQGIPKSLFPSDEKKAQKAWKKMVRVRVLGDAGMLEVSVYNQDRFRADQIALAIGEVLQTNSSQYHSRGDSVVISVIDGPITSIKPVTPNVPLNTGAGMVAGLLMGLAFIYLYPSKELHFVPNVEFNAIREHDWTQPMAQPVLAETNLQLQPMMYESADLKHPGGNRSKDSLEIGFQA